MLFSPKEKGQGLVEYALIIVLIAIRSYCCHELPCPHHWERLF